jgi:hypothetical protein
MTKLKGLGPALPEQVIPTRLTVDVSSRRHTGLCQDFS